jgi:hypothetical protein
MRTAAILSLVCLCGRTVELPDAAREAKCECGRTLTVEAVRNDELRTSHCTRLHNPEEVAHGNYE